MGGDRPRYAYKVMVSQVPREYRFVHAASIEEAEREGGIVILLLGAATD